MSFSQEERDNAQNLLKLTQLNCKLLEEQVQRLAIDDSKLIGKHKLLNRIYDLQKEIYKQRMQNKGFQAVLLQQTIKTNKLSRAKAELQKKLITNQNTIILGKHLNLKEMVQNKYNQNPSFLKQLKVKTEFKFTDSQSTDEPSQTEQFILQFQQPKLFVDVQNITNRHLATLASLLSEIGSSSQRSLSKVENSLKFRKKVGKSSEQQCARLIKGVLQLKLNLQAKQKRVQNQKSNIESDKDKLNSDLQAQTNQIKQLQQRLQTVRNIAKQNQLMFNSLLNRRKSHFHAFKFQYASLQDKFLKELERVKSASCLQKLKREVKLQRVSSKLRPHLQEQQADN